MPLRQAFAFATLDIVMPSQFSLMCNIHNYNYDYILLLDD